MNWTTGAEQFTNALSSSDPTPGGGAAAAMAGAMGCALVMMAVATTLKRKNTPTQTRPLLEQSLKKLGGLHSGLKSFIEQDAQAYNAYIVASKIPKDHPTRTQALQDALWFAATVPGDTATACLHVLKETALIRPHIASIILSDVECAQHLLKCAIACCMENIRVNLTGITQPQRVEKLKQLLETFGNL